MQAAVVHLLILAVELVAIPVLVLVAQVAAVRVAVGMRGLFLARQTQVVAAAVRL
jgi:hypothetical protein